MTWTLTYQLSHFLFFSLKFLKEKKSLRFHLSLFIAYIFIMSSGLNGTNSKVSTCNTQRNEKFFMNVLCGGKNFLLVFFLFNMHF